jgi:hypothetical protein
VVRAALNRRFSEVRPPASPAAARAALRTCVDVVDRLLREQANSIRCTLDSLRCRAFGTLLPVRDLMLLAEEARGLADDLDRGAGERERTAAKTVVLVRGDRPLIRR